MENIFVLIVAVLFAYFIKGLCGFANTLVINSLASFFMDTIIITPIESILALPSNLTLVLRNRKNIDWKTAIILASLTMLGAIPGVFFLKSMDASNLKIFFGIVVILLGIEMFVRIRRGIKPAKQKLWMTLLFGICSGILSGLFGVSAMLAAYVSRTSENDSGFKGTLAFVFTVDVVFRLILYIATGVLTLTILKYVAILFPFMALAFFIGTRCCDRLDEVKIKQIVIIMLIVSGVSLIATNL